LPKKVSLLTLHNQRAAVFEVLIKNEACFLPCDVTKTGKPLAFSGQWIVEEKEMTFALLQPLCCSAGVALNARFTRNDQSYVTQQSSRLLEMARASTFAAWPARS